jgi:hypothetical protein
MTEREDELAWREQVLYEKEHELNRIEETLAEKERSLNTERPRMLADPGEADEREHQDRAQQVATN